ncbi:MAG TPA: hypothetical protein VFU22_03485 [Roseiflexaceae bacterium]|nr:hypothetical protein [Roseiflexaceae bacterium]
MTNLPQTHAAPFSFALTETELEQILRQIDDNLARSALLSADAAGYDDTGDFGLPPTMPDTADLSWRLEDLRYMRAPLFVVKGRDWRNQVKRLLNVPIRVLNFKQISFNRQLLDLLDLMAAPIQRLPRQAEHQARAARALARQQQQVASLREVVDSLVEQIGRQSARIEQQQQALEELRAAVARLEEPRTTAAEQDAGR